MVFGSKPPGGSNWSVRRPAPKADPDRGNLMYSAHREAVRPSIMGVAIAIAVTYAVLFGALGPLGTGARLSTCIRKYHDV